MYLRKITDKLNNTMAAVFNKLFSFLGWAVIIGFSIYFFIDNVAVYLTGYRSKNFGTTFFGNVDKNGW